MPGDLRTNDFPAGDGLDLWRGVLAAMVIELAAAAILAALWLLLLAVL